MNQWDNFVFKLLRPLVSLHLTSAETKPQQKSNELKKLI